MDKFTQNLANGLRRFAMAGVGAISLTIDKSKEIIDQLSSRGEVTAAEGQAACDELQKRLTEQVSLFTQKLRAEYENLSFEQMLARCGKLTPEQKQRLLEELTKTPEETPADDAGSDSAGPEESASENADSSIESGDSANSPSET